MATAPWEEGCTFISIEVSGTQLVNKLTSPGLSICLNILTDTLETWTIFARAAKFCTESF